MTIVPKNLRRMTAGGQSRLRDAVVACEAARAPSRRLDARIAVAVFPGLATLPVLGEGVWRHADGSRVLALRYSSSRPAATSLMPPGWWIESSAGDVTVAGPAGNASGAHPVEAIALCIAALRARIAELSRAPSQTARRHSINSGGASPLVQHKESEHG
jgi:hypothetical protein